MEIKNIFLASTVLLSVVSVGFFIYSESELIKLNNDNISDACDYFFKYNALLLCVFLFSLIVLLLYLCCGNIIATILYVINAAGIGYLGYDKYYNEEKYCDIECQDECDELIDLSNNINIFFLVDFIIICVTFGIIGLVLLRKYCCV